jgi:prevent-host-death family protein
VVTRKWSVAEAKAQLSRVIADAEDETQVIESRGTEVAVVLGTAKYRELVALADKAKPKTRLEEFLALSRRIRDAGGAELEVPARARRKSPFGGGSR